MFVWSETGWILFMAWCFFAETGYAACTLRNMFRVDWKPENDNSNKVQKTLFSDRKKTLDIDLQFAT